MRASGPFCSHPFDLTNSYGGKFFARAEQRGFLGRFPPGFRHPPPGAQSGLVAARFKFHISRAQKEDEQGGFKGKPPRLLTPPPQNVKTRGHFYHRVSVSRAAYESISYCR